MSSQRAAYSHVASFDSAEREATQQEAVLASGSMGSLLIQSASKRWRPGSTSDLIQETPPTLESVLSFPLVLDNEKRELSLE